MPLNGGTPRDPLSLWNGATWLLGVPVLLELVALLAHLSGGWFGLGGLHLTLLLLAIAGVALSVPDGRAWLAGRDPHRAPSKRRWEIDQLPRGDPGPSYVIIETRSSYRGLRPRELKPGWYVLYVVFVAAPREVGDVLLTAFWTNMGRGQGRVRGRERGQVVDPPAGDLPEGPAEF